MTGLRMHHRAVWLGSRGAARTCSPYTVSAVCVHTPTVEQKLKKSQVPFPRSPKHSISQGCFLLEGKYTQQALTLNQNYRIMHTDSSARTLETLSPADVGVHRVTGKCVCMIDISLVSQFIHNSTHILTKDHREQFWSPSNNGCTDTHHRPSCVKFNTSRNIWHFIIPIRAHRRARTLSQTISSDLSQMIVIRPQTAISIPRH